MFTSEDEENIVKVHNTLQEERVTMQKKMFTKCMNYFIQRAKMEAAHITVVSQSRN